MKITEIINDLKRLNSYLPKDPRKNYANPLDRMARELWLIREFELQGDQKYVAIHLLSPFQLFQIFYLQKRGSKFFYSKYLVI